MRGQRQKRQRALGSLEGLSGPGWEEAEWPTFGRNSWTRVEGFCSWGLHSPCGAAARVSYPERTQKCGITDGSHAVLALGPPRFLERRAGPLRTLLFPGGSALSQSRQRKSLIFTRPGKSGDRANFGDEKTEVRVGGTRTCLEVAKAVPPHCLISPVESAPALLSSGPSSPCGLNKGVRRKSSSSRNPLCNSENHHEAPSVLVRAAFRTPQGPSP